MATPIPAKLPWELMNPILAQSLNPILTNPLLSGQMLTGIILKSGSNTINHGLGRNMQGWFLTDNNENVTVYRSQPMNQKTLTLTSSGATAISLWVF